MALNFNDDDNDDGPVIARPPAPGASGEKKTVEQWATAKGLYPQFFVPPAVAIPAGTQPGPFGTVPISMGGLVGPMPNHEYWKFAAAKASCAWPEGKEMTETEFDAAIKAAGEHVGR
jgi:hypothetical protein